MAALGAQSIASSYEQLLHVDADGGGNGTTLVNVKDGDNGTTFALQLASDKIQANGTLTVGADDTGYDVKFFGATATNGYMLWDESTDDLILGTSSKLGLGVTAPNYTLQVHTASAGGNWIQITDSDTGSGGGDGFLVGISGDETAGLYNAEATDMVFSTSATTRMTIDADGNVGIGVSPSGAPEGKLEVKNTAANDYAASFHNIANNAAAYGLRIKCGADDASGTTYYAYCMDGDGGAVGHIANTSGTFALTDSSDERIKENIRDTEIDGLDAINSMQVRDFEWKKSGNTCIGGFVAQELEPVFAPAVTGEDGAMEEYEVSPAVEAAEAKEAVLDEDGNVVEEAVAAIEAAEAVIAERILPMGISRDRLVPVLVKAIQELSAKVAALEG